MSNIKSKEDANYVVQADDLFPLSNNAATLDKAVKHGQIGVWRPVSKVDLSGGETNAFNFAIPAGVKAIKIEGILSAESVSVMRPAIQVNGETGSIYQWIVDHHTGTGMTTDTSISDTAIPFSSSWSNDEQVILEMMLIVDPGLAATNRHVIKSSTFNNGGAGDFHIMGGHVDLVDPITEINFITVAPFFNDYGVTTHLVMSVMD